jgi:HPt (histidine-containing phosphotransfer) domain-containing protein
MSASPHDDQSLDAIRAQIWEKTKDQTLARLQVLEQAATVLSSGLLTSEQRAHAAGESHKLAGSLGTFGFLEAGQRAREMEQVLKQKAELNADDGRCLAELLLRLRRELDSAIKQWKEGSSSK